MTVCFVLMLNLLFRFDSIHLNSTFSSHVFWTAYHFILRVWYINAEQPLDRTGEGPSGRSSKAVSFAQSLTNSCLTWMNIYSVDHDVSTSPHGSVPRKKGHQFKVPVSVAEWDRVSKLSEKMRLDIPAGKPDINKAPTQGFGVTSLGTRAGGGRRRVKDACSYQCNPLVLSSRGNNLEHWWTRTKSQFAHTAQVQGQCWTTSSPECCTSFENNLSESHPNSPHHCHLTDPMSCDSMEGIPCWPC